MKPNIENQTSEAQTKQLSKWDTSVWKKMLPLIQLELFSGIYGQNHLWVAQINLSSTEPV